MNDPKLWRYYDLIKFLTLLNGELYFARADSFLDKYEGAIPKRTFQSLVQWSQTDVNKAYETEVKMEFQNLFNEKKKKAAISCWHINDTESAAMWELYTKAGLGIAVKTTISRLSESIIVPDGYKVLMTKVNYIDFDTEDNSDYVYNELLPFKNKRKEFIYENEFRVMLYQEKNESELSKCDAFSLKASLPLDAIRHRFKFKLKDMPPEGVKVKVNPSDIIVEIIASPHMKKYEVKEIQRLLDIINSSRNTNFVIKHSDIYDNLSY